MLRKILNNKIKIIILFLLILSLLFIRFFEKQIFYDPLLDFFKRDFLNLPFPKIDFFRLIVNLTFRFSLNTFLSLGVIYVLFKDLNMVKFALIVYYIIFLILIGIFFLVIYFGVDNNNWLLFYIRRFLIQPIFLLLFLAGFYYQKQM
ncbi:exosortase F-associated protein [Flavobacterium sp. PL11]|uniref:exosortase F system-associated membrane protein n=1 Tax=Flavobacterium sp. PL11 TaxID=3071717 RepID=UPI002E08A366|nr:exosortase F-associated protein [Flavobacterium sp. PL11]